MAGSLEPLFPGFDTIFFLGGRGRGGRNVRQDFKTRHWDLSIFIVLFCISMIMYFAFHIQRNYTKADKKQYM